MELMVVGVGLAACCCTLLCHVQCQVVLFLVCCLTLLSAPGCGSCLLMVVGAGDAVVSS